MGNAQLLRATAVKGTKHITTQVQEHEVTDADSLTVDNTEPKARTVAAVDLFALSPDVLPKREDLISSLVHRIGLWIIAGKPKVGKSLLRRLAAVCVALGEPFCGYEVKQGNVLMLVDEDDLIDEFTTMAQMAEALGHSASELAGKVFLVPPQRFQIDNELDIAALTALAEAIDGLVLIAADPLIRLHGQDENSAAEMQRVLRPLAALARRWCVCVVHHTDKRGAEPRGTSDILASYRTLWRLNGDEGRVERITVSPVLKAGPTPKPLRIGFEFNSAGIEIIDLGDDLGKAAAEVLKALANGRQFASKTKLVEAIGVNRNQAFRAINSLITDGRIKLLPDGSIVSAGAAVSVSPLGGDTADTASEHSSIDTGPILPDTADTYCTFADTATQPNDAESSIEAPIRERINNPVRSVEQ